MPRALAILLILVTACGATGQEKRPNTLTPQEIAEGWILLFDGETTFGWKSDGDPVSVKDGFLRIGGKERTRVWFTTLLREYVLEYQIRAYRRDAKMSLPGRITWYTNDGDIAGGRHHVVKKKNPLFPGMTDETPNNTWEVEAGALLELNNVKLLPQGMQPLFNGKDLADWHIFPGEKYKSQFAVVDGAIHVTNGPGDLQTDGKYGDFVLQLECKSNGERLNSGLFFRCREGEYQNGYEAQVSNWFLPEPKEYTVEEYDPQTHKLLGKKKVASRAGDYGTGAIYRRVPARKQESKDGEWFTMTVVAQGNHFATWVNGVQQVDWYDNRPPSDNARTGCRREPGHLSIQGHDPTTDLSFRNLRLAELPAAK